ncbi:MAG: hypothetical protein NVSMB9_14970 [Isosphaeraceae bacterium]
MTARWRGRERSAAVQGRGLTLALTLALALLVPGETSAVERSSKVPTLYHKSRSFRIPFNIDAADRPRLKEVQLWVSEDSGYTWKTSSRTVPSRPSFTFRASRDAEYWFAVRTLDSRGRLFPGEDEKVEPSMKVIVDTTPPSLVLEPDARRGSLAAVRWEIRDEYLDLKSLVLEYQVEGGRDWRNLPIRRPALMGVQNWDAGTAEPLKVRASVSDKAGNVTESLITLAEGTPDNPGIAPNDAAEFSKPPPFSQISSGRAFPPGESPSRAMDASRGQDPFASVPSSEMTSPSPSQGGGSDAAPFDANDPFGSAGGGNGGGEPAPSPSTPPNAEGGAGSGPPLLLPSPRFPLQYAVEDAGPNGPATVELWVTQDGGRTWFRKGEDPDRTSPFPVDLGGEGTFGLRLVARAASGLGDSPPTMGDPPQLTVEVDSTRPDVALLPHVTGTGANLGKVALRWRAVDPHLGAKPVSLSWRAEPTGSPWQLIAKDLDNTGQYIWTVPATVPPRFLLRVDVVDTAGNRGYAESSEGSPIIVDRTRPRSRIIGLDPSARTGMGPGGARSLR